MPLEPRLAPGPYSGARLFKQRSFAPSPLCFSFFQPTRQQWLSGPQTSKSLTSLLSSPTGLTNQVCYIRPLTDDVFDPCLAEQQCIISNPVETIDPAKTVKTKKSDHSGDYRKTHHESSKPEDPRKRAPLIAETRSMIVSPSDYRSYGMFLRPKTVSGPSRLLKYCVTN
jgi:hypothetical protein